MGYEYWNAFIITVGMVIPVTVIGEDDEAYRTLRGHDRVYEPDHELDQSVRIVHGDLFPTEAEANAVLAVRLKEVGHDGSVNEVSPPLEHAPAQTTYEVGTAVGETVYFLAAHGELSIKIGEVVEIHVKITKDADGNDVVCTTLVVHVHHLDKRMMFKSENCASSKENLLEALAESI